MPLHDDHHMVSSYDGSNCFLNVQNVIDNHQLYDTQFSMDFYEIVQSKNIDQWLVLVKLFRTVIKSILVHSISTELKA